MTTTGGRDVSRAGTESTPRPWQALVRDAAEWRLIGRLFECPTGAWRGEIEALARELGDADLIAAVDAAGEVATEGQYHSVFGPGGPAPPREATYHDTLELGSLMSELAGYYDAFAYTPPIDESPDHIAVEIGFVAYLRLKEAYARAAGDDEHAALAAAAAARFIADHLAMHATPLANVLAASHLEYLARASRLLAARVGPRPRTGRLPVLPNDPYDEDGSEFVCATP
jgi:nitrate reductase assembly molybdenum cofactor insertion protein NarJ